jgi:hypothetical protein
VRLREQRAAAYGAVRSQIPGHNPAHAKLTALAGEWSARHDAGYDVTRWYTAARNQPSSGSAMSDLCTTTSPLLRHDWGFRATPPENLMRRPAQIRLLIIDDFALQPRDATETADANTLV